jgi:hypothetical protein
MRAIRAVDSALINLNELNEDADKKKAVGELGSAFHNLERLARDLLVTAI